MVDVVRVLMDRVAIRGLESDPATLAYVFDAARGLARRAADAAPVRTGEGAASIRPYPAADDRQAFDVSWGRDPFYLIFHEDGTRYLPARHFLRDAFESYIHT